MPTENIEQNKTLRPFPRQNIKETAIIALVTLLVVSFGIFAGYKLSGKTIAGGNKGAAPGVKSSEMEAGIADESTFSDSATGILEKGGISGEGTYHLVRDGGESQYVYLTSTVIDLEGFIGKKVTVWGQTTSAKKAGWLMDVGKVKVTN